MSSAQNMLLRAATSNSTYTPFYYIDRPALLNGISDTTLSIITPVVVYWLASIPFDILDNYAPSFLEKYRIHESSEERSRNRISKTQVVLTVMSQQLIQTLFGFFWLEDLPVPDHAAQIQHLNVYISSFLLKLLGPVTGIRLMQFVSPSWVYWWGIPLLQFTWAIFILDTWQYALHRLMHSIPFLYRNLHSWHHRLYIPYAYSALYNNPIEGILLDIIGALLSFELSGMSPRQGIVLFGFSTAKTVHDHCGWSLPWDPMQFMFRNNADYHDIHHQTIGIKHNFSQPFFVHWDTLLGTHMSREEVEIRRKLNRAKMKVL